MKIPLRWLSDYVKVDLNTDELVKRLTAIGHMQDKSPEHIGDDTVLDLEVRQNRPDCLSIMGIAREVSAVTQIPLTSPDTSYSIPHILHPNILSIENSSPTLCIRFNAVRLKLKFPNSHYKTPDWMGKRLEASGIPLISPLVDITNFVMLEYGEPMHAFDARAVHNGHIIIRTAKKGEKLIILGGRELTLTDDDLVIADSHKILSFSGLIGGESSGIQNDTDEVILEAATYNQAVIRRSSIRHAVRTEASTRHEKFLHPKLAEIALQRAVHLVSEICEATVLASADAYPTPVEDHALSLRLSEISRLGGIHVDSNVVKQYFKLLGFSLLNSDTSQLTVSVPYWRTDIQEEADLVEEVVRLYGYEHIPSVLPCAPPPKDISSSWFLLEEQIRDILLHMHFDEHITEPLTKQHIASHTKDATLTQIVLQNALNADKNALRTNLQDNLFYALTHRKKYKQHDIRLFELGKIYGKTTHAQSQYVEIRSLGCILHNDLLPLDDVYFTLKGCMQKLSDILSFPYTQKTFTYSIIDEHTVYVSAHVEDTWTQSARLPDSQKIYSSIPRNQSFDISCTVSQTIQLGDMMEKIQKKFAEIERISLGEKPRKMENMTQNILIQIVCEGSVHKDVMIEKIRNECITQYGATIR